jgi:hypothetical protein
LLQPINQRKIIRRTAKERLAKMNVRLDKSRKDRAAARVDDFIGVLNLSNHPPPLFVHHESRDRRAR